MKGWQESYSTMNHAGEIEECEMIVDADTIGEALTKAEETLAIMFPAGNKEGVEKYVIWDVGVMGSGIDPAEVF